MTESHSVNDRIDAAFRELESARIIALQNVGFTLSDGWEEVVAVAQDRVGSRGAVFFHEQDTERAIEGGGLMLAFGAIGREDEPATEEASLAIGHEVCEVLRRHGLTVEWNGRADTRLYIPPFEWREHGFTAGGGFDVLVFGCAIEHRLAVPRWKFDRSTTCTRGRCRRARGT